MKAMTTAEVLKAMPDLPHWQFDEEAQAITRRLVFRDFSQAFGFMTRVAMAAEQRDHHPEWFNVYNRVEITFSTHDAGGVTQRDLDFARWVDAAAAEIGA